MRIWHIDRWSHHAHQPLPTQRDVHSSIVCSRQTKLGVESYSCRMCDDNTLIVESECSKIRR